MTDHAKAIRDALMWAQAYVPDRVCHRLLDAEESLRGLLADHAAETERLRRDLRAEQRTVSTAADDLREARAENERLRRRFAVAKELADWGYDVQRVMRDGNAHYLDSLEGLREWFGPEVGTVAGELTDLEAALAAAQEPRCPTCGGTGPDTIERTEDGGIEAACGDEWHDAQEPPAEPCLHSFAPAYPADYLFCYLPKGHGGRHIHEHRRQEPPVKGDDRDAE